MANEYFGTETTVIPVLREDGTVYFKYAAKPISVRLCDWTLAFLWVLVPVVVIATIVWY